MDKDQVIKLRTILKAGKNLPLMIYSDNNYNPINESAYGQYTIWDDVNGIAYVFKGINGLYDSSLSDASKAISLCAIPYEHIQCMEIAVLKMSDIGLVIDSIKDSGRNISDEVKNHIIKIFETMYDKDAKDIPYSKINDIIGVGLNTDDDYYNGKMKESFQETRRYAELNKLAEKEAKKNN